jgi:hypothetical protein
MILAPEETARFYRIWFALLHYVNERRGLTAPFPLTHGEATLPQENAFTLRNALWADDTLRQSFIDEDPEDLPPADLELVASWRYRVAGSFYIERYLKKHTIFISQTTPTHAYGVLGLVSPVEEIVGPYLPLYVEAVLLPFEGRIIYDSLLVPYNVFFGSGIRASLKDAYRDAQEREGIITTLGPDAEEASPEEERAEIRQRNARVLAAFRKELARSGLSVKMTDQHVAMLQAFADGYMLMKEPPRGVLDLSTVDLEDYLATTGSAANRTSFKRFVRFLSNTGRVDYDLIMALTEFLKHA